MAELLQVDYEMHKMTNDPLNLALRRYAGMALTNLTFGDVVNKVGGGSTRWGAGPWGGTPWRCPHHPHPPPQATLCSRRGCMEAIVAQLGSDSEELHQVGAGSAGGSPGEGDGHGDGPCTHPPRSALPGGLQHPEEPLLAGGHQQQEGAAGGGQRHRADAVRAARRQGEHRGERERAPG